jgi:hypothetical protein
MKVLKDQGGLEFEKKGKHHGGGGGYKGSSESQVGDVAEALERVLGTGGARAFFARERQDALEESQLYASLDPAARADNAEIRRGRDRQRRFHQTGY